MNTTELFLTRAEHDQVLSADQKLLQKAFRECKKDLPYGAGKYQWSLEGVRFGRLTEETASKIRSIIGR